MWLRKEIVKERSTQAVVSGPLWASPGLCPPRGSTSSSHCEGEIDFTEVTRPAAKHGKAKSTCKGDYIIIIRDSINTQLLSLLLSDLKNNSIK